LPQPQAFMAALKRKAGLAEDFWAADVRLSRYRVDKHEGGPIAALGAPAAAPGAMAPSFGSLLGGGLTITMQPRLPAQR
jgi:hypothetical protein